MTCLEVSQLQFSVPKCLQNRATRSVGPASGVCDAALEDLTSTSLAFPTSTSASVCLTPSFKYHGSFLSHKLETARKLMPLRVPTSQSIWERESLSVNHRTMWECHQEHAMQNHTEAPPWHWAPDSRDCELIRTQPWLSLALVLLSSLFTHASWNHLPGELPEPESLVSRLALWESPTEMSDACGRYGQVGNEGLCPLPPNSCWSTNANMKVLGGGAFGK